MDEIVCPRSDRCFSLRVRCCISPERECFRPYFIAIFRSQKIGPEFRVEFPAMCGSVPFFFGKESSFYFRSQDREGVPNARWRAIPAVHCFCRFWNRARHPPSFICLRQKSSCTCRSRNVPGFEMRLQSSAFSLSFFSWGCGVFYRVISRPLLCSKTYNFIHSNSLSE